MEVADFAKHLDDLDRSPSTVRLYTEAVRRFSAWYAGTNGRALAPAELTKADVRDYRAHLQSVRKLAPGTVNVQLTGLRAWCAWLVDTGQIALNPADGVRGLQAQRPTVKWLERADVGRLEREAVRAVNSARTDAAKYLAARNHALLMVLLHTGLRVAEVCALLISDLSLGERSGYVDVRAGKGNKARRVALNVEARRPLSRYLESLFAWADPTAYVFRDGAGQPLRPRAVQLVIAHIGRRAGVHVTPHILRHTFAKSLLDTGAPMGNVADLLGHARLDTTRIYTRASERDLARDVERLEG